jgi:pyruvate/2-oxoglutarate/acetoin dehydrogenase E1 component
MRVVESLNAALHGLMRDIPAMRVIGEDLLDPYGGAFKVTAGLSTAFPDRVLTTPISEAGLVGVATGLALRGKPAVAEIMFGDFLTLAMDQLLNHATKFAWMFGQGVAVPLVVRTPMGGGRGYGPTHSQSLEKHFCGIPGLTVMAVHQYGDPGRLLRDACALGSPCLLVENKVLYAKAMQDLPAAPARPDVAVVAYGAGVEQAVKAAAALTGEEVAVEVVALTTLKPFPSAMVRAAARRAGRLVVVEEGSPGWDMAGECAKAVVDLGVRFRQVAGPDHPIPNSRSWEEVVLPGEAAITAACVGLLTEGKPL